MKCPNCNGKSLVKDMRTDEENNVTYRRRECQECGHIFFTSEMEDSKKLFYEADYRRYKSK